MPEATEIEKLVGDLEIAVDRVRSLYEQYFMGIEKLEPTVPRKDVDRRIHILRKEQIRNTAQRFRFQMIIQRYNTYQTHWQRVCREIENGTYKRHVLRAKERFGEGAQGRGRRSVRPPPQQALSKELADELAELDREFAPASQGMDLDIQLASERPPPRPPAPQTLQAPKAPPALPAQGAPRAPPPLPRHSPPGPVWRKASMAPPEAVPRRAPSSPLPPKPVPPVMTAAARAQAASVAKPPAPPMAKPAPAVANQPPPMARPAGPPAGRVAPPPPAAASPAPRPSAADLSEDRVRAIYAQYVDTKRRQNESTAAITYEAVAKSLRDSSAKLREKHGKTVDFEVAVRDGKAVLKPVLK